MKQTKIYNVLSIAGTDPGSGAGIQADLKTFSALGVYGTTVITALTAQNTCGIQSIYPVTSSFVAEQLESIFSDIQIHSIKIGLLSKTSIIKVIIKNIYKYQVPWIILDTVITSSSGYKFLTNNTIKTIKNKLLPVVSIITPNLNEAALLLNTTLAKNEQQIISQGKELLLLGCKAVIMKGGHFPGKSSPDWFISPDKVIKINSSRINTKNTHGTGCALSAAIAAKIPQCKDLFQACKFAKIWLHKALMYGNKLSIGKGNGPVHHFYQWW
ncbi:bifunctional hydroxymethylpyrimidine kinase/phosphomethylpyrimidine kinase (plasmid) [Candidatus Pantoea edessiphila]|uniref:hydroxymethylpyrimidine kinase n=1 Tax=Candidatus Pantoea edessiphila TaxID=2044610 RepID=A0A2P5SXC1_9GAMM|nr:bifunctional hydroxymethylpyrimidine kinase/phosphomethylpyrimidine kinase [Candidatus Pantoea edessiphila]MBK4775894.1 bifunctional hydroxymethylpyrimidine kinase/phosphomethylpyrimidine kinase [Pantoea sp. Edef]PPI86953.1 bifunctional hydroxymethylpyrimidine kinase/phosphomethylpyrimidine kinase [Candidatus Pantoea edessiphila]